MTFSYSGNPLGSEKDQVRFLFGDVDSASGKLSDEEIAYLLNEWEDDVYLAAAAAADIVSNNAAAYYNFSSDGSSSSIGELQERYRQVARTLRQTRNQRYTSAFYVGGVDVADVYAYEQDNSIVHPDFGTGMHDNLRDGGSSGGATREQLRGEDW